MGLRLTYFINFYWTFSNKNKTKSLKKKYKFKFILENNNKLNVLTSPVMAYFFHLFASQVCPIILLTSLFHRITHFVKGLIKTDHNSTRIFIHSFKVRNFLKECFITDIFFLKCFITARILESLGKLSKILDHKPLHTKAAPEQSSLKVTLCLITQIIILNRVF